MQKVDKKVVEDIMTLIRSKKTPKDVIEDTEFYDQKSGQYYCVQRSVARTITLWVLKEGVNP